MVKSLYIVKLHNFVIIFSPPSLCLPLVEHLTAIIKQFYSPNRISKVIYALEMQNLARACSRTHLNRMRLRSLPPCGSETKVISTPGSTCATHSFASSSLPPPPPPVDTISSSSSSSSSSSPMGKSERALMDGVASPLDSAPPPPPPRKRGVEAAELVARRYA
ncbi:hypothetical protein EE612_048156 [Oryza sativa]|nr:hypothetical protein EE612_048156 [Oryza sativa]